MCYGEKPDGAAFQIQIRDPDGDGTLGTVSTDSCFLSTSGGYERYFIADDGKKYCHILDPKTGMPAESDLTTVTVFCDSGLKSDFLSTLIWMEGSKNLPAHLKAGNFLRPTVLADVDNRMRVAQEEIFGPVACLLPFKDEAEGLRLANDVEYGLASYIWTQDVSKVLRLARGIEAGMVFVNTQNVRDLRQPFGGVKASGTGREGGEYSFEVFAEMKNVCISMGDHPIPKWGV